MSRAFKVRGIGAPSLRAASLALAFALSSVPAAAQPPAAVKDGTNFAKSIAPTSPSQLVNPAGVNPSAWAGNTGTPTAVPGSLGTFSAPTVSSTAYTAAKAIGLGPYGNQAVLNCATYNPLTGDPVQTQTCAAVNFLSNHCLSPTTQQGQIMAVNGTSQTVSGNCDGTYGQAQAHYGYVEQLTSKDPIFDVVQGLPMSAPGVTQPSCSVQTVVLTPAQYSQVDCTKDNTSSTYSCTQAMAAKVDITSTVPPSKPVCDLGAPVQTGTTGSGYTGQYCQYVSGPYLDEPLAPTCDAVFSFPDMPFLGEYEDQHCPEGGCVSTIYCYYKPASFCPANYTKQGSVCVQKGVQKAFTDNCGPYTTSSGSALPQP